jgi:hypothetical protein
MGDGHCPSCGRIATANGEITFTKVTVFQGQTPGVVCMKCGTITDATKWVRKKTRNANYQPNSSSSLDSHPLALLLNFVAGKYHKSVEVVVPLCESCGRDGAIEPRYVDFDSRSMTFVGHKAWKEECQKIRINTKDTHQ